MPPFVFIDGNYISSNTCSKESLIDVIDVCECWHGDEIIDDVVRRDPGQFGPQEIGARPPIRALDHAEVQSGVGGHGASFSRPHRAKFRADDASLRTALPFKRMHQ
jgi:hypothetical protein